MIEHEIIQLSNLYNCPHELSWAKVNLIDNCIFMMTNPSISFI